MLWQRGAASQASSAPPQSPVAQLSSKGRQGPFAAASTHLQVVFLPVCFLLLQRFPLLHRPQLLQPLVQRVGGGARPGRTCSAAVGVGHGERLPWGGPWGHLGGPRLLCCPGLHSGSRLLRAGCWLQHGGWAQDGRLCHRPSRVLHRCWREGCLQLRGRPVAGARP